MKILVACEESQAVTIAFRKKGHIALSCDILDCSGGHKEWHIKGDVLTILYYKWDMILAFPPCTYLCNSGVNRLIGKNRIPGRWELMEKGALFFKKFVECKCEKVVIENPIMHKYAKKIIAKNYDQIIHPYMFGTPERKATCLWLKGLPILKETNNIKKEMEKLPKVQQQKNYYTAPSINRSIIRSKTYPCIANAMAEQWG